MSKLYYTIFVLALAALSSDVTALSTKDGYTFDYLYVSTHACWLPTKTRDDGSFPKCSPGEELYGALCYPECQPGYYGSGPMCFPKEKYYSRGDGHLAGSGGCEEGTELDVLNCYTKCKPGYHGIGSVCWTDLKPYGRTVGRVPKICLLEGMDEVDGICYEKCPKSYEAVKNTCYYQACPKKFPYLCDTICTLDKDECGRIEKIASMNNLAYPLIFPKGFSCEIPSRDWKECDYTE